MTEREPRQNGHTRESLSSRLTRFVRGREQEATADAIRDARRINFALGAGEASNPNQTAEGFESWFNSQIVSQDTDPATKMRAIHGALTAVSKENSPLKERDVKAVEKKYLDTLPLFSL